MNLLIGAYREAYDRFKDCGRREYVQKIAATAGDMLLRIQLGVALRVSMFVSPRLSEGGQRFLWTCYGQDLETNGDATGKAWCGMFWEKRPDRPCPWQKHNTSQTDDTVRPWTDATEI